MAKSVKVEIEKIKLREEDQRTRLPDIKSLKESIRLRGLINPITIDDENTLIAGRCRLQCFLELHQEFPNDGWEKIPTTKHSALSREEKLLLELDENMKRTDLPWQDYVKAFKRTFDIVRELNPDWTLAKCDEYIGVSNIWRVGVCNVADKLLAGDQRIMEASSIRGAMAMIDRANERAKAGELNNLLGAVMGDLGTDDRDDEREGAQPLPSTESEKSGTQAKPTASAKKPSKALFEIRQGSFHDFAPNYEGRLFSFIHCDFPYGINHGESDMGGANEHGGYDDSVEVYWDLLDTLAQNINRVTLPQAYCMFWFSMKYYSETMEFFRKEMPNWRVDPQPLIWHKTDNKGIVKDPKRTARNVTETAFYLLKGDETTLVKNVANVYGAPTAKSKAIHLSEKPEPMLKHFFQMFVDEHTEILDPTAGGGSAIRAAYSMKARRGIGIELLTDNAAAAQDELKKLAILRELEI